MDRFRPFFALLLVALVFIGHARAEATAMALPFIVASSEESWRITPKQYPFGNGIVGAAVVSNPGDPNHFVVLRVPQLAAGPDALEILAQQLKAIITPGQNPDAVEKNARKIDFDGRDLKFQLHDDKGPVACELFVFIQDQIGWGVIYLAPGKTSLDPAPPFEIFHKETAVPANTVAMEPFHVKEDPLTSFAISFSVKSSHTSSQVSEIVVQDVPRGSDTEAAGVKVGDQIVAINGKKISEYPSGVGKKTKLGLIFLNRSPGDEVDLEILTPGDKKTRMVTLRIPRVMDGVPYGRR